MNPQRIDVYRRGECSVPSADRFVLYWMQNAFRLKNNYSLCHAVEYARSCSLPLVVYMAPVEDEISLCQYPFFLEGAREVFTALCEKSIYAILRDRASCRELTALAERADLVVMDYPYGRCTEALQQQVASQCNVSIDRVDSNVIVPIQEASEKQEYMAWTIRKKLHAQKEHFLEECMSSFSTKPLSSAQIKAITGIVSEKQHHPLAATLWITGGESAARAQLDYFLTTHLPVYHKDARDPSKAVTSNISPYLHFGHISPVTIYHAVCAATAPMAAKDAFIEQFFVRRELAYNFVHYTPGYDQYEEAVPAWARRSLATHGTDRREHIYDYSDLEQGKTADVYWNAAQRQMRKTGLMHNYMRMYWGKCLLAWSSTPEEAFSRALSLQNTYALDGYDPNTYTGVAWCFGRHDRPWQERKLYGNVRYMNAAGLKRKFSMDTYLAQYST
ncbi:deoxyribodipyrimidine photo-lyase [Chitinivibrio alkaliphilus]|uniref:Deoxyribodipyrimidine photo-lyase n=1 Tax=Chitinivibrio alkaliphilus ACht1 TaxID=1313304 RepID=U7D5D7_9BACT|nr:deoxyribodipyrimidine photo-lyase [Chitinivibrio alkaliphilus]ERP31734.1 DNA photolyase [Chitinivibrio alkaliphilus ACht1]